MTNTTSITGHAAITAAEHFGVQLRKYADPTAPASDITADVAREILAEDPDLVYVADDDVAAAIADADIRALRDEAATAGDHDRVALCALALEGSIWPDDHRNITSAMAAGLATMTPEQARAECARAIATAAAQREVRS